MTTNEINEIEVIEPETIEQCDVCGSFDTVNAPHMGFGCNNCMGNETVKPDCKCVTCKCKDNDTNK